MKKSSKLVETIDSKSFDAAVLPNYIKAGRQFPEDMRVSYSYIRQRFINKFKDAVDRYAEGNDPDKEQQRSSYYRKRLDDETWMCLRVANHDPNIYLTYYKFTRDLIPSTKSYANICLLFYGEQERMRDLSYSFRVSDKQPTIRVKQEDIQRFRPFDYTVYHYYPDIMTKDDISKVIKATKEWFVNNGEVEFKNPLEDKEYYITKKKTLTLNPLAQVMFGKVKIVMKSQETMNEQNIYMEGRIDDIIFAHLEVVDDNDNVIDTGKIVFAIDRMMVCTPTPKKSSSIDIDVDSEEYLERLRKEFGI